MLLNKRGVINSRLIYALKEKSRPKRRGRNLKKPGKGNKRKITSRKKSKKIISERTCRIRKKN